MIQMIQKIGDLTKSELREIRLFASKYSDIDSMYIRDIFIKTYYIIRVYDEDMDNNTDTSDSETDSLDPRLEYESRLTGFLIGHDKGKSVFYVDLICTISGSGTGTKLMNIIQDYCTEHLYLEIKLDSLKEVTGFYLKNGYSKSYRNNYNDLVSMDKFTNFDYMLQMLN